MKTSNINSGRSHGRRRFLRALIAAMLAALTFISAVGCAAPDTRESIVCSSAVIAEWTRAVLGEDAETVNIVTLGARGEDVHSYQPTVRDIAAVARCAVFIRNGGISETWADKVIASSGNEGMLTLALCEELEPMLCGDAEQGHGHEHSHDGHEHEYDEHIWLSFDLSCESVSLICETLSEARPDRAALYGENAAAYISSIREIEAEYAALRADCTGKAAVICDRDPFEYLWDYLGIEVEAAYEGCSAESEASFSVVSRLSRYIDGHSLDCVLICESSDGGIADAVISATRDKNARILTLDSMQSALDGGYTGALKYNLGVLREALGVNGD